MKWSALNMLNRQRNLRRNAESSDTTWGNRTGAREVNKGTGTTCISPVAINIDADHPEEFANIAYGIRMAHRGWLKKTDAVGSL